MPNFPKNTSPAMYKSSGFKMKNSALYKSAKSGSPINNGVKVKDLPNAVRKAVGPTVRNTIKNIKKFTTGFKRSLRNTTISDVATSTWPGKAIYGGIKNMSKKKK
jgi:hypothetical protein